MALVLSALKMLSLPSAALLGPIANASPDFRVQMAKAALHATQASTRLSVEVLPVNLARQIRPRRKRAPQYWHVSVSQEQLGQMEDLHAWRATLASTRVRRVQKHALAARQMPFLVPRAPSVSALRGLLEK